MCCISIKGSNSVCVFVNKLVSVFMGMKEHVMH